MGRPHLTPTPRSTLAPVWRQALPLNLLRDERMRRGVQRLVREQAALHGYRGRLRYRRVSGVPLLGLPPAVVYLLEVTK